MSVEQESASVVIDAHLDVTKVVIGDINSSVNEDPVIHISVPKDNSSQNTTLVAAVH